MDTTRRLTGVKPTGHLHLGNLLGAIRPLVAAQATTTSIALIADLHALTVHHDPATVRALTLEQATVLLAAGVDPDRTDLVVQSQVPEHCQLHYLLECTTGFGEAARMIQFRTAARSPGDGDGVRLSLLTYPVLMAADILLHDVHQVPVGDDQSQHMELARTISTRFNARYGDTFTVPSAIRPERAARVMDLAAPAVKMGKSNACTAGTIGLLDPPEVVRRTVMRAVTDTVGRVRSDPGQPGVSNLLAILTACTGAPAETFPGYGDLKRAVADAVEGVLAPIRRRHAELARDPGHVIRVLADGRDRARETAAATLHRARTAIGLLG
jgi:tryptophanyl-tRNA synthetase